MSKIQFESEGKTVLLDPQPFDENFTLVKYRAKAYKAFMDTGWVAVSKLVLFYGNNSAGKTAIVQPLKLLKSAYESDKAQKEVMNLWDLGLGGSTFSELHNVRSDEPIVFSLKFISESEKEVTLSYSFDEKSSETVSMNYENNDWVLNEFFTIRNVFFLEQKDDYVLDNGLSLIVSRIMQSLRQFLLTFSFIDPHRIDPRRYYVFTGGKVGDINSDGSNSYEMLLSMIKNEKIDNEEINKWLRNFGYRLRWKLIGNNMGVINLEDISSGYSSNLADNGFGIGQSLPLIVKMATIEGGTLLIDSPEAFLQSNMHGEMMDAILGCVYRGNNVIAEMGSEYMLYRLRRRIVDKTVDYSKIHLYFITDEGIGNSTCDEIKVDEFGELSSNVKSFNSFFSSDYEDLRSISLRNK